MVQQPVTGFPGVTLETDVRCRLRDGVELLADVYRPDAAGGPYPVLLQRTSYGKQGAQSETAFAHPGLVRPSGVHRRRPGRTGAVRVRGRVLSVP